MNPRERLKQAIEHLIADRNPSAAPKNGRYVEEPGQSFAVRTLARLELRPTPSHILTGPSGTGKTTQLRVLQRKLSEHKDLVPVYVNAADENIDFHRPGRLIELLLTGVNTIIINNNRDKDGLSRALLAAFLGFVSGKPSSPFLKLIPRMPRKVVLLVDLQDRLTNEAFDALCRADLATLKQYVGVVMVAPPSVSHDAARARMNGFDYSSRQLPLDPAQSGTMQAFLMQVISQRVEDLIPHDGCARLVSASGGVMGDLLALACLALEEAYVAHYNRAEPEEVDRAIAEFGRKHIAGLDNHDLARLQRLRETGTFAPTDDRDINLLATRRILEYTSPTGASTFAVHPALLPLLAPSDPLDDL